MPWQLTPEHPDYPSSLSHIYRAPQRLYGNGNPSSLQGKLLSIVGSRTLSAYGESVLTAWVPQLVRAGLTIVSGLAYGVDICAHRLALAEGGVCVAVLGSGLEKIYPVSHAPVAAALIQKGGCVITEYAPRQEAHAYHFPERNRIIAGLSSVTLVVEAGERSGALITGRLAAESGRDVAVVPGNIFQKNYGGIHQLLRQGAHPVARAQEVLELYGLYEPEPTVAARPPLTGALATLYDFISHGITSSEKLLEKTGYTPGQVASLLSYLELEHYITCKGRQWQILS